MKYRSLVILLVMLFVSNENKAQDLEYKFELGGAIGPCFYLGDASSTPFKHSSLMAGVIGRRTFNPRMSLKANLAFGHLSGNSEGLFVPTDADSKNVEGATPTYVSFKRNVIDLGTQFEFNFWGYGLGGSYKGYSPITPYVTAGAGFTLAIGGGSTDFALNLPIGVGVKYKVKPRVNVGAEWTVRFTTTDKLDFNKEMPQLNQPYGIQSAGFKNKDAYSFFKFFVTYDLCPIYRKCNN